jgi:hypothetical protein
MASRSEEFERGAFTEKADELVRASRDARSESSRVLERSRDAARRANRALEESRRVDTDVVPRLRRAGLVR